MPDDLTAGLHRCGPSNAQHQESSLTSVTRVTPDTAKMLEDWTSARVGERLRNAVALTDARLRDALMVRTRLVSRLPSRPGDGGSIPTGGSMGIIGGIGSAASMDGGGGDAFGKAVEALSWLWWLDEDDAGIVLARLEGASWKAVCWHHGISRPTADRRWRYALALIAWRLNGNGASRRPPSLRTLLGMRRVA